MATSKPPTLISLFTGAGGLDLGLEAAGFAHILCIENDGGCLETLRNNRPHWRISTTPDVLATAPSSFRREAGLRRRELTLLAGGPPCQPFSKAGQWHAGSAAHLRDPRASTLTAMLDMVEEFLPRWILIENVRGFLGGDGRRGGIARIKRGLSRINREAGTAYRPVAFVLNCADYGVPQTRQRVFIVAERTGRMFAAPAPTHGIRQANSTSGAVQNYMNAWDAIGDLEARPPTSQLEVTGKWAKLLPHIPPGKNYSWLTARASGVSVFGWRRKYWSFLLKLDPMRPSWTISANPGPSIGPFHWTNRKLSIRELARIQTFPDDYRFPDSYRDAQRQIGNAVPPLIGFLLGREMRVQFGQARVSERNPFQIQRREIPFQLSEAPPSIQISEVDEELDDHPGVGQGPGARRRKLVSP